ncbi:glycogen debranching protein GlgX [Reinekea forsetii]|nr:glycogen debranching protein GlgX [Reinekea forsetii]
MITRIQGNAECLPGRSTPLGVQVTHHGVNFAVHSPEAEKVELCFFNEHDEQIFAKTMPARTGDVWHIFVPEAKPGQRYGYRVYGEFNPQQGRWFNPHKVMIDPYAQELSAPIHYDNAMLAYQITAPNQLTLCEQDNAHCIPKAIVPRDTFFHWTADKPDQEWRDVIIYEMHVKGFSQLNEAVPESIRGTYLGVAHSASISHLKKLGVTCVELLPCFAFMSEPRLSELGLTNYWGYNPALFLAPEPRYAKQDAVIEFKEMVNALHEAGIEVILDVVYNHTAEGGYLGPSIANKGLHAKTFYRHQAGDFSQYIDNSGCGNSVNSDHPYSLQLILDSMRHWVSEYKIDGFRFDLAASLGRESEAFSSNAAFFKTIQQDPTLARVKLIAEPWDIAPGGYQLGQFPQQWYECNDQFRDTVRRFWKGDLGETAEFATRLMGSHDVFQKGAAHTTSSINYVTYHDGFTLHDLVSYNQRHNLANLEKNKDGHGDNLSCNYGVEGETDDSVINALRAKQKRNFIATLMLSQGAIHLLGGDELGRTQQGNNNAYCQDNEISWFNWAQRDLKLEAFVQQMIALRKSSYLFNRLVLSDQAKGESPFSTDEVHWLRSDGYFLTQDDWHDVNLQCFGLLISNSVKSIESDLKHCAECYLILFNASGQDLDFHVPSAGGIEWNLLCDTARNNGLLPEETHPVKLHYLMQAQSVVVLGKVKS